MVQTKLDESNSE